MLRFYGTLLRRTPKLLFEGWNLLVTLPSLVITALALFNRQLADALTTTWEGLPPYIALAPLGVLFAYGLLRANYEQFRETEQRIKTLEAVPRPQIVFKGCEVDRDARAVQVLTGPGGEQLRRIDPAAASWSRVRIANDPGDGPGAMAQHVAALVTFFDGAGTTHLGEIEGRWASEKQAPEMQRLGLTKEGRTVDMPANGDDHFPLDIAMKFDEEEECYAYNDENGKAGSIRLPKHRLVGSDFYVQVRVKGTNTARVIGWFKLRNPGPGEPLTLQAVDPPTTSSIPPCSLKA